MRAFNRISRGACRPPLPRSGEGYVEQLRNESIDFVVLLLI
jgi:hypothetical protein